MQKQMISVKEVAKLLGVSASTIYTMTRSNEIPHFKLRGRLLFNQNDIEIWLDSCQRGVKC